LAAGIACSVLIALFMQGELSFDRFHADADRIYRVIEERICALTGNRSTSSIRWVRSARRWNLSTNL
jgi:putative ABC transport system permease protein